MGSAVEVFAAQGAGKKMRITAINLSFSAAVSYQITKSDGTTVLYQGPVCAINVPNVISFPDNSGPLGDENDAIKIITSGSANGTGTVEGDLVRSKRTTYTGA